ncbi:MAG: hypothetical protein PHD15_01680 [Clostridia bacterium]|nr:hypothetical protein [Clostridia bacterium]MDD4386461.1 hypothetical protein [Clostridia bacterium]
MDFLPTKALIIGVGITVSLAITSAILFTLNQLTFIYQDVYKTDISIKDLFVEFSKDETPTVTGLEVYNIAKKYKNSTMILVKIEETGDVINTKTWLDLWDSGDVGHTSKLEINRLYVIRYEFDNNKNVTVFFKRK